MHIETIKRMYKVTVLHHCWQTNDCLIMCRRGKDCISATSSSTFKTLECL